MTFYEYGSARAAALVQEEVDVALVNLSLNDPDKFHSVPIEPRIEQKVGLIWRKGKYTSNSVEAFLSFVRDYPLFPEEP